MEAGNQRPEPELEMQVTSPRTPQGPTPQPPQPTPHYREEEEMTEVEVRRRWNLIHSAIPDISSQSSPSFEINQVALTLLFQMCYTDRVHLNQGPQHLLNWMLAHAGVYSTCKMRQVFETMYRQSSSLLHKDFWIQTVNPYPITLFSCHCSDQTFRSAVDFDMYNPLKNFRNLAITPKTNRRIMANQCFLARIKKLGVGRESLDMEIDEKFEYHRQLEFGQIGRRIKCILGMLRKLSLCKQGAAVIGRNPTFLRLIIMLIHCDWEDFQDMGLELLANVAVFIELEEGVRNPSFAVLYVVINEYLMCRSLRLHNRVFQILVQWIGVNQKAHQRKTHPLVSSKRKYPFPANFCQIWKSVLLSNYIPRFFQLLTVRNSQLIIGVLRCIFGLTTREQVPCDRIANFPGAVKLLLLLLFVVESDFDAPSNARAKRIDLMEIYNGDGSKIHDPINHLEEYKCPSIPINSSNLIWALYPSKNRSTYSKSSSPSCGRKTSKSNEPGDDMVLMDRDNQVQFPNITSNGFPEKELRQEASSARTATSAGSKNVTGSSLRRLEYLNHCSAATISTYDNSNVIVVDKVHEGTPRDPNSTVLPDPHTCLKDLTTEDKLPESEVSPVNLMSLPKGANGKSRVLVNSTSFNEVKSDPSVPEFIRNCGKLNNGLCNGGPVVNSHLVDLEKEFLRSYLVAFYELEDFSRSEFHDMYNAYRQTRLSLGEPVILICSCGFFQSIHTVLGKSLKHNERQILGKNFLFLIGLRVKQKVTHQMIHPLASADGQELESSKIGMKTFTSCFGRFMAVSQKSSVDTAKLKPSKKKSSLLSMAAKTDKSKKSEDCRLEGPHPKKRKRPSSGSSKSNCNLLKSNQKRGSKRKMEFITSRCSSRSGSPSDSEPKTKIFKPTENTIDKTAELQNVPSSKSRIVTRSSIRLEQMSVSKKSSATDASEYNFPTLSECDASLSASALFKSTINDVHPVPGTSKSIILTSSSQPFAQLPVSTIKPPTTDSNSRFSTLTEWDVHLSSSGILTLKKSKSDPGTESGLEQKPKTNDINLPSPGLTKAQTHGNSEEESQTTSSNQISKNPEPKEGVKIERARWPTVWWKKVVWRKMRSGKVRRVVMNISSRIRGRLKKQSKRWKKAKSLEIKQKPKEVEIEMDDREIPESSRTLSKNQTPFYKSLKERLLKAFINRVLGKQEKSLKVTRGEKSQKIFELAIAILHNISIFSSVARRELGPFMVELTELAINEKGSVTSTILYRLVNILVAHVAQ